MEELLRSRVGRYSLSESHTLAQVEAAVADGTVRDMIDPVEKVLADYPALYANSYGNNKVTIRQMLNSYQSDINWFDRRDYGIPEDRG